MQPEMLFLLQLNSWGRLQPFLWSAVQSKHLISFCVYPTKSSRHKRQSWQQKSKDQEEWKQHMQVQLRELSCRSKWFRHSWWPIWPKPTIYRCKTPFHKACMENLLHHQTLELLLHQICPRTMQFLLFTRNQSQQGMVSYTHRHYLQPLKHRFCCWTRTGRCEFQGSRTWDFCKNHLYCACECLANLCQWRKLGMRGGESAQSWRHTRSSWCLHSWWNPWLTLWYLIEVSWTRYFWARTVRYT